MLLSRGQYGSKARRPLVEHCRPRETMLQDFSLLEFIINVTVSVSERANEWASRLNESVSECE